MHMIYQPSSLMVHCICRMCNFYYHIKTQCNKQQLTSICQQMEWGTLDFKTLYIEYEVLKKKIFSLQYMIMTSVVLKLKWNSFHVVDSS